MADEPKAGGGDNVVKLPLRESPELTPQQAIAAAGRLSWSCLGIVGYDEQGHLQIFSAHTDPALELLLAEELRLYAMGIGAR